MKLGFPGGQRVLLAGVGHAWVWIAAGAVAVALVILLYQYERRLVSRRVGLALLSLRLAAGVVLVLALFEPISARTYRETVRGRVILGVDLSDSMTTVDASRPADDRRKLIRVLKLSPAEPPEILSRQEIERRLLEGPVVERLAADHTMQAVGFARDLVAGSLPSLSRMLGQRPPAQETSGRVTDWGPVLEQALKGDVAGSVIAVVLLTDGQQNGPGSTEKLADRLAARGVTVFPVLVGSTVAPRDAAIAAIRAPQGVYRGDTASIEVTVKLDAYPAGTEIPVTLERAGANPMRQSVRVPDDGSRPVVVFRVPFEGVGSQPVIVTVTPPPGDTRSDNDQKTAIVQVTDGKARVLLVDGDARWEFRYLRNALQRDPGVQVESVVFHQPALPDLPGGTYASALPAPPQPSAQQSLAAPDSLGAFDAIVVGDVSPADLNHEAWARLELYVAERGGTLILSPGPRFWPAAQANDVLRKLVPVLEPQVVEIDPAATDPAHPTLPPGAAISPTAQGDIQTWPMLQFASDAAQSLDVWKGLPWLPWVLAGRIKPGASALAVVGGKQGLDTSSAPSSEAVAIAAQPYGLGKVLWVGTDGTWRWRYRVGDLYHHRFWGQVVRWAALGKLAAGNRFVRFGPLRPQVVEGESVRVQARIAEGVPGISSDLLIAARVFRPGRMEPENAVAVVPLQAAAGQPRTFEGVVPPLPEGAYVVRLAVPQHDDALGLTGQPPEASLHVAPPDTTERIELAARRDTLERLASATGGRVLADHEFEQLPGLLHGRTLETVRTEETSLWDKPGGLVLFFMLLTCEWILRKRVGLP